MNTICDIDSIIYEISNIECVAPDETDVETDSDDDSLFDDRASSSRQCLSPTGENNVDLNLFVGLIKILVHDVDNNSQVPVNKRKANYEELASHTVGEAETPEVAWFYRNQFLVQKSELESEDKGIFSSVQSNMGHCQLLNSMLRECLLKRRYRQAAYAVWALASLTRDGLVNRDLFVVLLKASLQIFMAKTANEGLSASERSHYHLSSLEKFIQTLLDCRNVDPREVGIDWLLLLLHHGRYSEATQLQQQIEKERRKQFHHRSSDPRMEETKRLFTALSGFTCFVYAKMLRKGIEDEAEEEDERKTMRKSVKFLDDLEEDGDEYVEKEDEEEEEDAKHLGDRAIGAAKRELKASQMDEFAANAFEEAIFNDADDIAWDAFVPPYISTLERKPGGQTLVFDLLERFRDSHPANPNSHRFLFEYVAGDILDKRNEERRRIRELDDRQRTALRDSLISYNKLAPMDKTVAFKLVNLLEFDSDKEEDAEKCRRQIVGVLFNLLDYPEWKRDSQCWRRLVEALTDVGSVRGVESGSVKSESDGRSVSGSGSEGSIQFETLLRTRSLMKREWFETRADWWPKMHFGARSAAEDLRCLEGKSVVKRKNLFAKFVERMARNKLFANEFDSTLTDKCFKAYGERIKTLISQMTVGS